MKPLVIHPLKSRTCSGSYLLETLVACVVGAVIMLGIYSIAMASYRSGTTNQNQILASNMAQQLIDNARNCTWGRLKSDLLNGNITYSETVPLYEKPTNTTFLYNRPLLRQSDLNYSAAASNMQFHGTVTQTLLDLNPGATAGGMIQLDVDISWFDTNGNHTYHTSTIISENGIHN